MNRSCVSGMKESSAENFIRVCQSYTYICVRR